MGWDDNDLKKFSSVLKKLRKKQGLTQQQLASALDMSESTIIKFVTVSLITINSNSEPISLYCYNLTSSSNDIVV
jgi:DNA-binding transcriptional regulator LsrR (DeoR family)